MSNIAVIANIHVLPEVQKQIQSLSDTEVVFLNNITQPSTEELIKIRKHTF